MLQEPAFIISIDFINFCKKHPTVKAPWFHQSIETWNIPAPAHVCQDAGGKGGKGKGKDSGKAGSEKATVAGSLPLWLRNDLRMCDA